VRAGHLHVGLGTGTGFADDLPWSGASADSVAASTSSSQAGGVYFVIPVGPLCIAACYLIINPGADGSQNVAKQKYALRDVDGDGAADVVASDNDASMTVGRNPAGRSNLLKSVSRPLGGTIHLDYQRQGNTTDDPQPRWAMTRVSVADGHPGDGVDTQLTTYAYSSGVYDRAEREFLGFGTVTTQLRSAASGNPVERTTIQRFSTDSYYTRGLLLDETLQDGDGQPFTKTAHHYRLRDVETGGSGNPRSLIASEYPELIRTDRHLYEGQATAAVSTSTTYEHDALGDITRTFDAGDAGTDDDLTTALTYTTCPGTYVHQAESVTASSASAELRRRDSEVDCATGEQTTIRAYPGNGPAAVTDFTYADNGNLTRVVGPANLHAQRYTKTYIYDPSVQTYVTSVTDSFDYTSSSSWDLRFGSTTSTTDAAGATMTYKYDEFGRMLSVSGPYDQGGITPTIRFEYHPETDTPASTPWALTRRLDKFRSPTATIDTVVFVDGLDRPVQSKQTATVKAADTSLAADVMTVSGHVTYDASGRVATESYPITEPLGQAGVFNSGQDSVAPTVTSYDVLDRPTRVQHPDGTVDTFNYGFAADKSGTTRSSTTSTDANGIMRITFTDIRGQKTATKRFHADPGQPPHDVWTTFTHDAIGQLLAVADPTGNTSTTRFDELGRTLNVTSPDAGSTDSTYDPASNLVTRTPATLRAAGTSIRYDYDSNRRSKIIYPNNPGNNVTYAYGAAGATDNSPGRLISVTYQAGRKQLAYGKLGEVVTETKTVASDTLGTSPGSPEVYTTNYLYDTFGRLQKLTYPDGELVSYTYDTGGLPLTVTGAKGGFTYPYVQRINYD
jgi:YD repeat-containing protein